MKIVFAAPHFPPKYIGGTERVVERLANRFYAKGYSVDVIVVEEINRKGAGVTCQSQDWGGINIHRLSLPENNASDRFTWSYRNPLLREWFLDYLSNSQPDLLHFHSGYLISGSILEAALSQNLPTIVTLHDFWFICPQITLLRTNGDLCEEPVPSSRCEWCLLSDKRRYRLADEFFNGVPGDVFTRVAKKEFVAKTFGVHSQIQDIDMRRSYLGNILEEVDLVISPSVFLRQKFLDYGIHPKKFIQLPFGLELTNELTPPSDHVIKDNKLKIGYMGQISDHKGVHILIEAFKLLKGSGRVPELHIYGDGQRRPEYLAALKRKANNHPSIFFEGTYTASDVSRVFDNLDVVVVPSIWYENRPSVILEAFSRKKPVIASDLGGMAEMVTHDVDGLRFQTGDARSLSEQLQRVLDNPGLLTRLATAIQPVLAVDEEIDELEKVYACVIDQHQNSLIQQS
jgi:glycosyltransferase involved in cell wall biosynthesis